nr:serine-rich adhesin for platelets-like [Biomphalaria glabrata]
MPSFCPVRNAIFLSSVGTLRQFSKVTDHHVAKHGFDCDHFTPSNRPHSIKFNYSLCELTPVHALRGVDMYRKDGLCSSHLFKLWPIALKDSGVAVDDLDLPKVFSSPMSVKRRYKPLKIQKQRRKTIQSIDEIFQETSCGDLQSSKSENMSKSQPTLVPVDTSGAGFQRMASFRRSMKEEEIMSERDKQKRRRRTVTGVPENIMQEIEQFERGRQLNRDRTRNYSLDDLDQKDLDAKDEVMQQYLQEIESAIAEREEEEYAIQKEAKLLKFLPCRRSRSLPRCMKLISSSHKDGLTRSSLYLKKHQKGQSDEFKLKQSSEDIHSKFTSSLSLGSQRSARSSKRSSIIGEKIKSLVSNTLKPRPKSMDFDLIDNEESKTKNNSSKTLARSSSLTQTNIASMPETTMSRAPSSESQVGPGTYYYFNHTLPRAQAKKYDFPWDSLPKDWTTSVKLREISKRRKEDRQSSSGNWSQSGYSSNRQSLESDTKSSHLSTTSQYSLGKDSGRDSIRYSVERDGLDTGYMGDAASNESISDTKSMSNTDSDEWLRSLAERAASREDVTSTSAEALANLSRLTKQNIRNLDILVPGRKSFHRKRNNFEDDGESSVYSLDTEGFYTSFHSDSGLKRSTTTLLDEDDIDDMVTPGLRDTKSLQSMVSYNVLEGAFFKTFDDEGSDTLTSASSISAPNLSSWAVKKSEEHALKERASVIDDASKNGNVAKKGKKAPPPPPRVSSMGIAGIKPDSNESLRVNSLTENNEASPESSDHEVIYARLKKKTNISVHGFPSWCVGNTSDEEDTTAKNALSASQERLCAESSEVEAMFSSGKESWLSGTLPRGQTSTTIQSTETTNSWPRIKRPFSLQAGILKTPEKDKVKISGNPKTLNFDPVVSLFDAQSPHSVQLPLSRLSSSDESASSPTNDMSSLVSQNNTPSNTKPQNLSDDKKLNESISKYRPTFSPILESKTSMANTTIQKNSLSSDENVLIQTSQERNSRGQPDVSTYSSDLSTIHSISSLSLSSFDSFDMSPTAPLFKQKKSNDSLSSSTSTIALSDIDTTSLTHVTMVDGLSLSGSSTSLSWDNDYTPNTTPLITPIRKKSANNVHNHDSSVNSSLYNYKDTMVESSPVVKLLPNPASASSSFNLDSTAASQSSSEQSLSVEQFYNPSNQVLSGSQKNCYVSSDRNNNKTVSSHQPAKSQSTSSLGQENSHISHYHTNDQNKLISEPHQRMSYSGKDRRRSTPVTNNNISHESSTSAHSGNESGGSNGSYKDVVRRRRSGTDVYSPADSGFGSPSKTLQFGYPPNQELSLNSQQNSKMPKIKQTFHSDSKPYSIQKSTNDSNYARSDYPVKALSSIPSQSEESLTSQFSVSSTNQLIGKVLKTDLSQPVLHSSTSSESLQSSSSAGRSDSYRVALLEETDQLKLVSKKNSRAHSSGSSISAMKPNDALVRFAQSRALTVPGPTYGEDNISRADSYRCAVGNTMGAQVGDIANRNSSYRLATNEEDIIITDNRMDSCNLWTGKTGGTRDIRRMGITDIDQLKQYKNDTDNRNSSNTLHAKKMLGVKKETDPGKASPSEQKKLLRQTSKDRAKQQKTQSSTYIRFDPIFESGEDLRASSESLRPPSIVTLKTLASTEEYNAMLAESAQAVAQRSRSSSQTRQCSLSQGRKSSEEKPGLTIFNSIKTTFKSIGGKDNTSK